MKAFCTGFPGWMWISVMPRAVAQSVSSCDVSSGPLSRRIASGRPGVTVEAQPVVALPEAPPWSLFHDRHQRLDYLGVAHGRIRRRRVPGRPRQPDDATRSSDRELVLRRQHLDDMTTRGRRHSVRLSTSLMAAFSSARSAYIRFSLAFSASSSFMRFTSAIVAPA